jgi:hypothetical protein
MNTNEEVYLHRQAIIEAATESVLGEDYYNYCCDSWSCAEMCMEDILYKLPHGKKYVKKYREIMAQKNKELEERYQKEMDKFEFHVGDYVETKDGNTGYISSINKKWIENGWYAFDMKWNSKEKLCDAFRGDSNTIFETFNRIGKYDFTKPQKQNKIEPLNKELICDTDLLISNYTPELFELAFTKINEIINYINYKED